MWQQQWCTPHSSLNTAPSTRFWCSHASVPARARLSDVDLKPPSLCFLAILHSPSHIPLTLTAMGYILTQLILVNNGFHCIIFSNCRWQVNDIENQNMHLISVSNTIQYTREKKIMYNKINVISSMSQNPRSPSWPPCRNQHHHRLTSRSLSAFCPF